MGSPKPRPLRTSAGQSDRQSSRIINYGKIIPQYYAVEKINPLRVPPTPSSLRAPRSLEPSADASRSFRNLGVTQNARFTHRRHCSRACDPIRRLLATGWTGARATTFLSHCNDGRRAKNAAYQLGRGLVTVGIGAICLRAKNCLPSFIPGASTQ